MTNYKESSPTPLSCKAIVCEGLGGPEVIKIVEHIVKPPQAGEVRIRVKAAAVNPTDELLRKIDLGKIQFPAVPGVDASGIIESIGESESRLKVGDEVIAVTSPYHPGGGAQSALITVPSASVTLKPKGTTFSEAAGLSMNGLTALLAIEMTGLQAGQVLAVSGGAGVLAHYAIAAAKKQGIKVIADAKPQDRDLVKSYGADIVLERGDNFIDAIRDQFPDGVDAFLDTAVLGGKCLKAIRDGGVYIHVRLMEHPPEERNIRSKMVWVPDAMQRTDWLDLLKEMVENGDIKLRVAGEYQPEQVAEAQQALAAGGLRGRPVILF